MIGNSELQERMAEQMEFAVSQTPEALAAENAKLREELADAPKCETCEAMLDCDECLRADGSHKERRRLKADNAKLRELVDAAHMSRLLTENENESLRELVRGMYAVMVEDAANCDVTYPEQFDDRMRELGVVE